MSNVTTVSAAENPALANKLSAQAISQVSSVAVEEAIQPPADPHVKLIAGYQEPFGKFIDTAEVRELNGADEEAVAKASDMSRGLMTILERAVVKLGDKPTDPDILDALLAGDRELLLLEIRKKTFGKEITLEGRLCEKCVDDNVIVIDLEKDVELKPLDGERTFDVSCSVGKVRIQLPTGGTQKALVSSINKTAPELDTIVLKSCVVAINDQDLIDPNAVLKLSIRDRRKLLDAIADKNPGPQLSSITKPCPSCGQEVSLPLTLADLFQQ